MKRDTFKNYYQLTKPGIVYGNAVTVIAGFLLASWGDVHCTLLLATLVGLSLVVASGCVFNNYIDSDIDALMERTKYRSMVRGVIPPDHAILFGSTLLMWGLFILTFYTNLLAVMMSFLGFLVYVGVYSLWIKRTSTHGTIVGSIAGAMPPLVGYLAASSSFDSGAVLLFIIVALWQMPHSFAVGIYRLSDYQNANIPLLPVVKGIKKTKIQMLVYTFFFTIASLLLFVFGYTSLLYVIVMSLLCFLWLTQIALGLREKTNDTLWAKRSFLFSIIIITLFSLMISL